MLTIVTSHEVRESVSDSLGTAWYDSRGYEADDKCAWHNLYQMTAGHFWIQPEVLERREELEFRFQRHVSRAWLRGTQSVTRRTERRKMEDGRRDG